MAENYKHLYEQMRKMVAMYQDEVVPGLRNTIEDLKKNQIQVRCKDCVYWDGDCRCNGIQNGLIYDYTKDDDYCSYGKRSIESK